MDMERVAGSSWCSRFSWLFRVQFHGSHHPSSGKHRLAFKCVQMCN